MNQLQKVFNYENNQVRTLVRGEEVIFIAKDVCAVLEISKYRDAVSRLDADEKCTTLVQTQGGKQKMICLNQKGILKLVASSRSLKSLEIANLLGLNVLTAKVLTKEQATLSTITEAFKHLKTIFQYPVYHYRIDLYFPEINLAVECDEHDHRNYKNTDDVIRQVYIEKKLGCRFIRFNPDEDDFNIGTVINEIIKEVYVSERTRKSI